MQMDDCLSQGLSHGQIDDPRPTKASGHFLRFGDALVILITLNTFGLGSHSNNMHSSCFGHEALWCIYFQHPFTCVYKSYVIFYQHH
jgi:hypothetical protein